MGGANMVPVGACDTTCPTPGSWEDVTPLGHSSKAAVNGTVGAAIIVDPFEREKCGWEPGGENDEIWRSDDCGATWTQVNTGPGGVGDGKSFGGVGDGAQWSMQADPSRPACSTHFRLRRESMWKTVDGGQSWKDVLAGSEYETHAAYRFVNNVSLDPTDHLHVGGVDARRVYGPYGPSCIGETKDAGRPGR